MMVIEYWVETKMHVLPVTKLYRYSDEVLVVMTPEDPPFKIKNKDFIKIEEAV